VTSREDEFGRDVLLLIINRQFVPRQMPDGVDDNLVAADFKDCAMRRLSSESVQHLSQFYGNVLRLVREWVFVGVDG
jgi:hypothetical protein